MESSRQSQKILEESIYRSRQRLSSVSIIREVKYRGEFYYPNVFATLANISTSQRPPCLRTLEAVLRGCSSRRVANFSIPELFPGTGFFYKKPFCRILEKGFQRRINREVSVSVGKSGGSAKQPFYLQSDQTSQQV